MARRLAAGAPLLLGLALLAAGLLQRDARFGSPESVLLWFAAPALLVLLGAAFALLPPKGRLALASALLALGAIEGSFHAVEALRGPQVAEGADPPYYRRDETLGYAPKPGVESRVWKRVDGERVYEVEYAFDEEGRRVTPVEASAHRDRFLLCFGGSFMFGEGVEDSETLPARLGELAPSHRPYNYAFRGYGPRQLLAKLESGELPAEVPERRGLLLYLFIDGHVRRAIGSLVVHGWAHATPYYVPGPEGIPRRHGTLTTGRPATALLYSLLGASAVLDALRIDLPPVRERHVEWTARVLGRAAELFHRQLGKARFVVAIYPHSRHGPRLARALEPYEVEVRRYPELFRLATPGFAIPHDGHPSARAHRVLARELARDLGIAAPPTRGRPVPSNPRSPRASVAP